MSDNRQKEREDYEHGSDPCFCGDYRSQHPNNGSCSVCAKSIAPYDGCRQFRFTRHANEDEMAHWKKYHLPRLKADHMGNSIVEPSTPQPSEREKEIRERFDAINQIFARNDIRHLLSLLDAERKRVQELQEHEDDEAKFMVKRGVLYNCTFIDGWAKVLDERDELKERVQELEGVLRSIQGICNATWPAAEFTKIKEIADTIMKVGGSCAESPLPKEQK